MSKTRFKSTPQNFLKSAENRDIIILIFENQTMTCIATRTIRKQKIIRILKILKDVSTKSTKFVIEKPRALYNAGI